MLRLTPQIHSALSLTRHAIIQTIQPNQFQLIFNHFNIPIGYKLTSLSLAIYVLIATTYKLNQFLSFYQCGIMRNLLLILYQLLTTFVALYIAILLAAFCIYPNSQLRNFILSSISSWILLTG